MFPVLFSLGPLTVYTFGLFALLSLFFGSFILWKRGKEANLLEEEIFDSLVFVAISGLVSARVAFIVFHFERFGFSVLSWLSFFRYPGLSFYGGLIGGLLALWLVCRRKDWSFFDISDIAVTGLSLAQAIGWVGAFFSGMGVGRSVSRFGLVFVGFTEPRFPVQLVWIVGFSFIFIFLWKVENRYRTFDWYRGRKTVVQTGFQTFSYLIGFGILQLLVASVVESKVYWLYIPTEILVGLISVVVGSVGLYLRSGRELSDDKESLRVAISVRNKSVIILIKRLSIKLSGKLGKRKGEV